VNQEYIEKPASPVLVRILGDRRLFQSFWRKLLNALILRLQKKGITDDPYSDLE